MVHVLVWMKRHPSVSVQIAGWVWCYCVSVQIGEGMNITTILELLVILKRVIKLLKNVFNQDAIAFIFY